jgi:hypothetical protein
VLKHFTRKQGWWIFAKTFVGIVIELNKDQMKLCRERYGNIQLDSQIVGDIPDTIEVTLYSNEKLTDFPVGTDVGVTFAQSGQLEQFFQGTMPLGLFDLRPMNAGTYLECEVLPAQGSLGL